MSQSIQQGTGTARCLFLWLTEKTCLEACKVVDRASSALPSLNCVDTSYAFWIYSTLILLFLELYVMQNQINMLSSSQSTTTWHCLDKLMSCMYSVNQEGLTCICMKMPQWKQSAHQLRLDHLSVAAVLLVTQLCMSARHAVSSTPLSL